MPTSPANIFPFEPWRARFARSAELPFLPRTRPAQLAAPLFSSYWMGGFEGADHVDANGMPVSMCELTQHDACAAEDYRRLADLGIRTVRESAGWRVIDRGGRYDFRVLDTRAQAAAREQVQIVWTLFQYGWPAELNVFSAAFVERFARYAAALAAYVGGFSAATPVYAPISEISYLAWAAATPGCLRANAMIPPHRAGEFKLQLVRAAIAACDAILSVDPRARFISTDPLMHIVAPPGREDLAAAARRQREIQFEAWDMLCGRAYPQLGGKPRYLDMIGVNYYPGNQWDLGTGRALGWHLDDPRRVPLSKLLGGVYERYGRPLLIAETGHSGVRRANWLREIAAEVVAARRQGIPVEGVCLYPVLDRPDWNNIGHWHDCGLWHLERMNDGALRRCVNPAYAKELRNAQRDSGPGSPAPGRRTARVRQVTNQAEAAPISPRSYS